MAGNVWGADVAQLRMLAQSFGQTSETLLQQSTALTAAINNNTSWKGADSARFTSEWNGSHRALIQQTARALKQQSKQLLTQADEQEKASNAKAGSGGGPLGPGTPGSTGSEGSRPGQGRNDWWGPDWLTDPHSPFRDGWDMYGLAKALPNLRAGLFDLTHFISKADSVSEFFSKDFRNVAKAFQDSNMFSQLFNTSSELFDGRWDTALNLAEGGKAAKFFEFGGKALGGLGVGLDVLDTVNHIRHDEKGAAVYSGIKAGLGVASFAPPPVGTAAMVASGALAIYDNVPVVHEAVNAVGESIADGAKAAWDNAGDAVDKVGDFFGF